MQLQQRKPRPQRNDFQIVAEIIDAARTEMRSTIIMRKTNMNLDLFMRLKNILTKAGILEEIQTNEGIFYKATERGYTNYQLFCDLGQGNRCDT